MQQLRMLSVQPIISMLSKAAFWTHAYFYFVRSFSVLIVGSGMIQAFQAWALISKFSSVGLLGGLIFEALFILNITLLAQLTWIRAEDFKRIPADPFTLLRIGSKLSRLSGEVFAIGVGLYSISSGILYWFAGAKAARVVGEALPMYPIFSFYENNFIHGITVMITGTVAATAVLIVSYLLAQTLSVLVGNALKLRTILPESIQHDENEDAA